MIIKKNEKEKENTTIQQYNNTTIQYKTMNDVNINDIVVEEYKKTLKNQIFDGKITFISQNLDGIYVMFEFNDNEHNGFISLSDLKISTKQQQQFSKGRIPPNFNVGNKISFMVKNSINSEYHNLSRYVTPVEYR
jgi:hypothetical protein